MKDDPTTAVSYDYVARVQTAAGEHKLVPVEVKSLQSDATLAEYREQAGDYLSGGRTLYTCSFGDDAFDALVPAKFRRQCLHQAALLGCNEYFLAFASLYVSFRVDCFLFRRSLARL